MDQNIAFPIISPIISVGCCLFLSIIYVSSLYVWSADQNRDHPSTVKKRFFSVFVVMLVSPIFVYLCSPNQIWQKTSILDAMGFRMSGIIPATIIPLLLTIILFLGPIAAQAINGVLKVYTEPVYWLNSLKNLLWLRNHIVAPLSEEFTFRACMMPLLLHSFQPFTAVCITPLFFGVAHFHHMIDRLKGGMEMKTAIIISCIQFTYTTIFGVYSAYLFAKTGHFVAPFVAHAFCNHMGFPDIQDIINHKNYIRYLLIGLYIVGFVSWILLLPVVTNPQYYDNNIYWTTQ